MTLNKSVRTLRDRQERKLRPQQEELKRTEDRRSRAENRRADHRKPLPHPKRGTVRCAARITTRDCPEIEIPLDPLKTPQQNAAALFSEYAKRKAAASI